MRLPSALDIVCLSAEDSDVRLVMLEAPPPEMQALFAALHGNQDATNAFLSAITGAIPLLDFMSHENLSRIIAAAKPLDTPVVNQP
jgi:hypothetical protein